MDTPSYEEQLTAGQRSSRAGEARRNELEVSLSIRTILLVAGVVALAWALASIASVLLVIFVSLFSIAVLSPVVTAMERRLGWSRRLSATVLVLAIVVVLGGVVLVVVQAIVDAVGEFSDDLPQIVDQVPGTAIWAASSTAGATRSTRWRSTRARSRVGWPRSRAASPTSASRPSAR